MRHFLVPLVLGFWLSTAMATPMDTPNDDEQEGVELKPGLCGPYISIMQLLTTKMEPEQPILEVMVEKDHIKLEEYYNSTAWYGLYHYTDMGMGCIVVIGDRI